RERVLRDWRSMGQRSGNGFLCDWYLGHDAAPGWVEVAASVCCESRAAVCNHVRPGPIAGKSTSPRRRASGWSTRGRFHLRSRVALVTRRRCPGQRTTVRRFTHAASAVATVLRAHRRVAVLGSLTYNRAALEMGWGAL